MSSGVERHTPEPPYSAVVFTSLRQPGDAERSAGLRDFVRQEVWTALR
mgnify:CR=1 FL=1